MSRASAGLLTAIVAACLIETVHAADPDRALSQYIRDRWSLERA